MFRSLAGDCEIVHGCYCFHVLRLNATAKQSGHAFNSPLEDTGCFKTMGVRCPSLPFPNPFGHARWSHTGSSDDKTPLQPFSGPFLKATQCTLQHDLSMHSVSMVPIPDYHKILVQDKLQHTGFIIEEASERGVK